MPRLGFCFKSAFATVGRPKPSKDTATISKLSGYCGLTMFFLSFGFFFAFYPSLALRDPDTLWHIKSGQWIFDHGRWPYADVFSHTYLGHPWMAKEWLSQLILASAYKFGGWPGIAAISSALYATIAAVLSTYLTRILRFSVAIGLAGVTVLLMTPHFLARPHLFGYVILSIWLISLLNSIDNDRPPSLWLAVLMLVWANTHSSFVLGIIFFCVVSALLCFRFFLKNELSAMKRTLLVAGIVLGSAIVTPYGFSPLFITWSIMGMNAMMANLREWQPPNFREYPALLMYLVGFLVLISGSGTKLCLPRLSILAITAWIGFSYTRGFILFLMVVPLIIARPVAQKISILRYQIPDYPGDAVLNFFWRHANGITTVVCGLTIVTMLLSWQFQKIEPSQTIAPISALDYIKNANTEGPVFNSYDFGGFLIFSNVPTFADGRADLYGDRFLGEYFTAVNFKDETVADRLLNKYKVTWVLLRPSEPLAKALIKSKDWRRAYVDQNAVVFVRE